jgi:hypothetical protein
MNPIIFVVATTTHDGESLTDEFARAFWDLPEAEEYLAMLLAKRDEICATYDDPRKCPDELQSLWHGYWEIFKVKFRTNKLRGQEGPE